MLVLWITVVVLLVVYLLMRCRNRPANYPPGPISLPLFGNLSLLKKKAKTLRGQHLIFKSLAEEYKTNVVGLRLGNQLVVTALSYPIVKTILTQDEFIGRPDTFFLRLRSMGTRKGITFTDGEFWAVQRHFVVRHLRDLGFGKQLMEERIKEELEEVLSIIDSTNSDVPISPILAPAIINVLWTLTAGTRISRDNQQLQKLLDLMDARAKAFDMSGGALTRYPWLRHVLPEGTGYNLIKRLNGELYSFFMKSINEHHEKWSEGKNEDLIYAFITEMKRQDPKTDTTFTDDQLLMVCMDLFIAGSQTTSNTLGYAFLMMLLHPDVQAKVQQSLDEAMIKNMSLNYADRYKVPYVEAVLLEVQRFYSITPIIGPRRVLKDTTLDGYYIPKETTVLISIYSVHMDKDYWGDPETFRPERFLDSNGDLCRTERVLGFGLGKRRCLGESLARNCIFLFFSEILRYYTITPSPGKKMPTGVPLPGITQTPEKYSARFVRRTIG